MLQATRDGTRQPPPHLQHYVPPVPCDVHSVGLSVSHVPVVHIDVIGLLGASQAVADLQIP